METPQKSLVDFWKRPEGTAAKVIVAGLVLGGVVLFAHFLPFLIALAENTLYLAGLLGLIGLLGIIVTAERPRTLLFFALQMISRAITRCFVNIDVETILRAFVSDMKKQRVKVTTAITAMMGVRQKSKAKKSLKEKEMADFIRLADVATNDEKLNELTEKIGRRQRAIEQSDENIAFADETIAALQRVDRVIEYHINNSEDEMNELLEDNEMALQMLAATHAAGAVLGESDKLEIRNMAADVIRDRSAKARGEVESLLESTRSVQGEIDLNQLALRADGKAKLAALKAELNKAETQSLAPKKATATARVLTEGPAGVTVTASPNRWANRLSVKPPTK
jgi:hypothetical protein